MQRRRVVDLDTTSGEENVGPETSSDEALARAARRRQKRKERSEKIDWYANKLHATLWVATAIIAMVFSDFWNECINGTMANRPWVILGLLRALLSRQLIKMKKVEFCLV